MNRLGVAALVSTVMIAMPATLPAKSLKPIAVREIAGTRSAGGGMHFVFADRKGHVSLLATQPPRLTPLKEGRLVGSAVALGGPRVAKLFVRDAAMDAYGDRFALLTGREVWIVEGDRAWQLPPPPWMPTAVGEVRGEVVAAVMPMRVGPGATTKGGVGAFDAAPPLAMSFENGEWTSLVDNRPAAGGKGADIAGVMKASSVRLVPGHRHTLWIAETYAYRIRRYSPAGRRTLTLSIDEKNASQTSRAKASNQLRAKLKSQGYVLKGAGVGAVTGRQVVQGLAAAPDGTLYVLVDTGDARALDRYDPVRNVIERCPLQLKESGRASLACGRDGLYIAPQAAKNPVYEVAWETLEAAGWTRLSTARIESD